MTLAGKKIAILIAPRGTEEPEFVEPKGAVEAAGDGKGPDKQQRSGPRWQLSDRQRRCEDRRRICRGPPFRTGPRRLIGV